MAIVPVCTSFLPPYSLWAPQPLYPSAVPVAYRDSTNAWKLIPAGNSKDTPTILEYSGWNPGPPPQWGQLPTFLRPAGLAPYWIKATFSVSGSGAGAAWTSSLNTALSGGSRMTQSTGLGIPVTPAGAAQWYTWPQGVLSPPATGPSFTMPSGMTGGTYSPVWDGTAVLQLFPKTQLTVTPNPPYGNTVSTAPSGDYAYATITPQNLFVVDGTAAYTLQDADIFPFGPIYLQWHLPNNGCPDPMQILGTYADANNGVTITDYSGGTYSVTTTVTIAQDI